MRYLNIGFILMLLLSGCGGWGDYVYKSDRFKYKITFPKGWEVWDRSTEQEDYLDAEYPDIPEARITVMASASAPDISPNELYPSFMDGGGDATILTEFAISDKGAISSKNREGRQITYTYLTEKHRINGMRVLFIGNRYIIRVKMEMPVDSFVDHEAEFHKMISMLEL